MKIDWHERKWTVWHMETGAILGQFEQVSILCRSELVNTDGGAHGYLIVNGQLEARGDRAVIR